MSLSRGSLSRGSLSRGVSVQEGGLCPEGSLSRGVSVQGALSGGSLSWGVSVQGVSVRETPPDRAPLYGNQRAISIWNAFLYFVEGELHVVLSFNQISK